MADHHLRLGVVTLAVMGLGLGFSGWQLPLIGADCGDMLVASSAYESWGCNWQGYALLIAGAAGFAALVVSLVIEAVLFVRSRVRDRRGTTT